MGLVSDPSSIDPRQIFHLAVAVSSPVKQEHTPYLKKMCLWYLVEDWHSINVYYLFILFNPLKKLLCFLNYYYFSPPHCPRCVRVLVVLGALSWVRLQMC